jgi:hypothetical protein
MFHKPTAVPHASQRSIGRIAGVVVVSPPAEGAGTDSRRQPHRPMATTSRYAQVSAARILAGMLLPPLLSAACAAACIRSATARTARVNCCWPLSAALSKAGRRGCKRSRNSAHRVWNANARSDAGSGGKEATWLGVTLVCTNKWKKGGQDICGHRNSSSDDTPSTGNALCVQTAASAQRPQQPARRSETLSEQVGVTKHEHVPRTSSTAAASARGGNMSASVAPHPSP